MCEFRYENVWISIKISLKFVPKGLINNIPALAQIRAWRRPATSYYLNQWWLVYWRIYMRHSGSVNTTPYRVFVVWYQSLHCYKLGTGAIIRQPSASQATLGNMGKCISWANWPYNHGNTKHNKNVYTFHRICCPWYLSTVIVYALASNRRKEYWSFDTTIS